MTVPLRPKYRPTEAAFSSTDYEVLAELLGERIAASDFFSGTIECECGDFSARLIASLIIYRTPRSSAPPSGGEIYDIVPIWWEMHTLLTDGSEVLNDFELRTLVPLLITTQPPTL